MVALTGVLESRAFIERRQQRSDNAPEALGTQPSGKYHFFGNSGDFLDALLDMVRRSTREILVEFYIVEDDAVGNRLLEELHAAARRGVAVRLIVDGFGSLGWIQRNTQQLWHSPIELRIYHPIPWSLVDMRHALGRLRELVGLLGTFNRRDHRKLVVVDGCSALLGSHNIWDASLQWQEAGLSLAGPEVATLAASFERVWLRTRDGHGRPFSVLRRGAYGWFRPSPSGRDMVLDNTTLRSSRIRSKSILALIAGARKRLWITTPYLFPHRTLLRLIKARARAGVDVRLILPRNCDVTISRWMAQTLYTELLGSGVAIYELAEGVLHAKVMVADDRFLLGSSNLNHRSFMQDLELDYLGSDAGILQRILHWKNDTLEHCERVDDVAQIPMHALKRCIALLLKPFRGSL